MDDITPLPALPTDEVQGLVRAVTSPDFGEAVLAFVSRAGPIRNFGTFHCPPIRREGARPVLVLTLWAGAIGSYWFKRNAAHIAQTPEVAALVLNLIRACPEGGTRLDRHHPRPGDGLYPMYRRAGLLERCSVTTRRSAGAFHSFFLRSQADGPIPAPDWPDFAARLSVAQELIILRHRLAGSEASRHMAGTSISSLRERGAEPFAGLAPREAQVCDAIIEGLTVAGTASKLGVSETTVRTLRQRSYRKLSVASALELTAIVAKDAQRIP